MDAIPEQLAETLPQGSIRTGARVESINQSKVVLSSGETVKGQAVVLATEGPEAARLVGLPLQDRSRGEICLYYAASKPPVNKPYLVLNGDGTGWVNSLTVPSVVAPTYAPAGQHLVSVVVIGHMDADDSFVERAVHRELTEWFGPAVGDWRHLKTDRILHALSSSRQCRTQPLPYPRSGWVFSSAVSTAASRASSGPCFPAGMPRKRC